MYYIERDDDRHFTLRPYQKKAIADLRRGNVIEANKHGIRHSLSGDAGMEYVDTLGQVWAVKRADWFSLYRPGYGPPAKSRMVAKLPMYAKRAFVVCGADDDEDVVARLVSERVPVNIGGDRSGSRLDGLRALYGYTRSAYNRMFDTNSVLPPNIGVYTYAPVWLDADEKEVVEEGKPDVVDVHLYHAIGYAFDSVSQPDYRANMTDEELTERYKAVFDKVVAVCHRLGLTKVALPLIGCGTFAARRPGLFEKCWAPAFAAVFAHGGTGTPEVCMMGHGQTDAGRAKLLGLGFVGSFPKCLESLDLESTLVVNAWDPHSAIGNGNGMDNSLDGFVGRQSAATALGTPQTNMSVLDRSKLLRV